MQQVGVIRRTLSGIVRRAATALSPVWSSAVGSWWWPIRESYAGAWQQNVTVDGQSSLLAFSAVFACVTGIAADVAKMRVKLDKNNAGIWEEVTEVHGNSKLTTLLAVLRKPNRYQTRIKFIEQWIVSKLLFGNAYILKQRDRDGNVVALYVLDPQRVTVLVGEDGSVWYRLMRDNLSDVSIDNFSVDNPTVPSSEIIHDMMVSLWHPLVGVSPLYACGISATMGNKIQANSTQFFANLSMPGGMLSSPGHIADDTAKRLKAYWEENFGGKNIGRVAVAGDGLKFETFSMPAQLAQLIEQLRFTVEDVGRAFHYPQWKLGGPMPPYSSGPQALTMMYYNDCLQVQIEAVELCLDEGLEIPAGYGTELDTDNLMRMDTAMLYDANSKAVGGGWMSPDEARYRANLAPVTGGDTPYLQQQNFSLEALAKRDAMNPLAQPVTPTPLLPAAKEIRLLEAENLTAEEIERAADEELAFA